jgi:hypothetical protein
LKTYAKTLLIGFMAILLAAGCRTIDSSADVKSGSASTLDQETKNLEQMMTKLHMPEQLQANILKISKGLRQQAGSAVAKLQETSRVVANGTPAEKANLVIGTIQSLTLAALPVAVPIMAVGHTDQLKQVEARLRKELTNYFAARKQKMAAELEGSKWSLPPALRRILSPSDWAKFLGATDNTELTQQVANFYTATDTGGLALAPDPEACHPFMDAQPVVRQCSLQEMGLHLIEWGVSMLSFLLILGLLLSLVNSSVWVLPFVLLSLCMILQGAFLAWGQV